MKIDNRRKRNIVFIVLAAVLLVMLLTSCDMFDIVFGSDEGGVTIAPKLNPLSPPRVEKLQTDHIDYETGEWKVYSDSNSPMAVNTGDEIFFVIDYVNKSDLTINKVVFTYGNDLTLEVPSKSFEGDSTNLQSKIKVVIDQEEAGLLSYKISKIFFNNGAQVVAMELDEAVTSFVVNVNPTFTLSIDEQNGNAIATTKLDYKYSLNRILEEVLDKDTSSEGPKKEGGWVFRGYYTKPDGGGVEVKNSDVYYFWKDITLYANYERLFDFKVVSAADYGIEPIEDVTVDSSGKEIKKTYSRFAVITKKTNTGDLQDTIDIYDTILDDSGKECAIVEIGDNAFANTRSLRTLRIGKFVGKIGKGAFYGSRVTSITFAAGGRLTYLGEQAFYGTPNLGATALSSLTLPDTVTYLGDRCFEKSGWAYMKAKNDTLARSTLTIYPNITHIGNWCFVETKFSAVEFAAGVLFKPDAVNGTNYVTSSLDGQSVTADSDYYLGYCLFKNCPSITRFLTRDTGAEDALAYIAPAMFDLSYESGTEDKTIGLQSVSLGEGLKRIAKGAFYYQKNLKSVSFPNTLEDICSENALQGNSLTYGDTKEKSEYGAFEDCSSLATVIFGENSKLKVFGCNVFRNCRVLKSVNFTSKVLEQFGDAPFQGCDLLTEVYFGFGDNIPIPTPIEGYKRGLTSRDTGSDLFYPYGSFKVFVGEDVVERFRKQLQLHASDKKNIQVFALEMIKDILAPNGKVIGKMALEEITLKGITGWNMGYFFSDATEIVVPDFYGDYNIIKIGSYAFNKQVEEVSLSMYVQELASFAFKDCTRLTTVHYGTELSPSRVNMEVGRNHLVTIGEQAFANTSLTYFIGGQNLSSIGNEAFYNCRSLDFVDFGASVELRSIGTGAFNACRSMRYVRLPLNLTSLPDSIFAYNTSLLYFVINNENPTLKYFPNAASSYFVGVSDGQIKTYTMNSVACETIQNCSYLPDALKGKIVYDNTSFDTASPGPEQVLNGFRCNDWKYQQSAY